MVLDGLENACQVLSGPALTSGMLDVPALEMFLAPIV